jgi:glucan phosphorylase
MSISITTINNEAAVAKTFTKVGGDRQVSEYYNSTDASATFDSRLFIKQQIVGKTNGIPNRRALVQSVVSVIDNITGNTETFTVNLTLTGPIQLQNLSTTNRKDALAYVRNLVTAAVEEQLAAGEL